jgi:hypothetical protein
MKRSLPVVLLASVLPLAGMGCASSPPKLVPAQGKLLYKGAPLPFTLVQFSPPDGNDKKALPASGTTEQDGSFKLKSYPHGDGARPGPYKVFITPYPGGPTIPSKYTAPETTTLEVTIPEQGADNLVLTLTD